MATRNYNFLRVFCSSVCSSIENTTIGDVSKYATSQSISSDQMFGLEKPVKEHKSNC